MQGRKVRDDGAHEVWMKPLADGSRAVILFNRGTEEAEIAASWDEIGLFPGGEGTRARSLEARRRGDCRRSLRGQGRAPRRGHGQNHAAVV